MKLYAARFVLLIATCAAILCGLSGTAAAAGVNDFTIQNYQIDYYLGRDSAGHSTLKTVESITALFPQSDQNHGIERAIPNAYAGHSTALTINSVTDETGKSLNYTTRISNDDEVLRIGDANTYVHGSQTYKLTYTQLDVTKYFANTDDDEFYWDTNGTEWLIPTYNFSAAVHLQSGLASKATGKRSCYIGAAGSNANCQIDKTDDGYRVQAASLQPGENITVAIGFPAHSFTPHKTTLAERFTEYAAVMAIISLPLGLLAVVILGVRYNRASMRKSEHTTIVPEYVPPRDTSVTIAASIYSKQTAVFSAQLIDFAVRHYTKIYQTRAKSFFRPAKYEIEIIKDISDLHDEEQEIFRDIFPSTAVGTRLDMASLKNNTAVSLKVMDNKKKIDAHIKGDYALRARVPEVSRWFKRAALVLLLLSIPLLSFWLAGAAVIAFIMSFTIFPLTDKGLDLYHYLEGLKLYIKTAEVDRIKMLQTPEGALKLPAPIDTSDKRQLIQLYEKVLPYAILFGLDKSWNNELGRYYEELKQSPDWYSGGNNAVFNAALFSSAISNFNTAAAYSGAASSSSGGSSGGGSSGGGGGGGGGGGW